MRVDGMTAEEDVEEVTERRPREVAEDVFRSQQIFPYVRYIFWALKGLIRDPFVYTRSLGKQRQSHAIISIL
jgi:hypothetical protein